MIFQHSICWNNPLMFPLFKGLNLFWWLLTRENINKNSDNLRSMFFQNSICSLVSYIPVINFILLNIQIPSYDIQGSSKRNWRSCEYWRILGGNSSIHASCLCWLSYGWGKFLICLTQPVIIMIECVLFHSFFQTFPNIDDLWWLGSR